MITSNYLILKDTCNKFFDKYAHELSIYSKKKEELIYTEKKINLELSAAELFKTKITKAIEKNSRKITDTEGIIHFFEAKISSLESKKSHMDDFLNLIESETQHISRQITKMSDRKLKFSFCKKMLIMMRKDYIFEW